MKKTLAEYRSARHLTQKQLAEKLGFPVSTIAMYETGARTPTLRRAQKIAEFFGVRIEDIFFGEDAHEPGAQTNACAGQEVGCC